MLIRLTTHVLEGNNVKTTIRPNRDIVIPWVKGQVIEVSEATGEKLLGANKAEKLSEEEEASERAKMAEEAEARRVAQEPSPDADEGDVDLVEEE